MQHYKHLLVVLLILLVVGTAGVLVGKSLIPADFHWRDGWFYRAESLEDHARYDPPAPAFAAAESCLRAECHGEKAAKKEHRIELAAGHEDIGCQACHGPALEHVKSAGTKPGPTLGKDDAVCWLCHRVMPGRPPSFKVIDELEGHVEDVGGDDQDSCFDCHNPHTCEADY